MLKVLTPITFTRSDSSGINMAFYIAKHQDCHITLLNCIPDIIDRSENNRTHALTSDQLSARLIKLEALVREHNTHHRFEMQIDSMLEHGYPEEVIPKIAAEKGYDLVIMTSDCSENDMKMVTGSITNDVLRKIKTSLMVVPTHYSMQKERISDVLICIDFLHRDYSAMHQLFTILLEYGCTIHCVKVNNKKPTGEEIEALNKLNDYLTQTYRGAHFRMEYILGHDFYETVNKYIAEHKIQFVTLIKKHPEHFLRRDKSSSSSKALYHIKIPILIVSH